MLWLKILIAKFLRTLGYELRNVNRPETIDTSILSKALMSGFARGVLHIGAHHGQEASAYDELGLKVLWIEGNPSAFSILQKHLSERNNQSAICALLGDKNLDHVAFYLTDNQSQSASIMPLSEHHGFNIENTEVVYLDMKRLDSLLSSEDVIFLDYWIIDVQGAELQVLRGSQCLLQYARFIQVEISTFQVYKQQHLFEDVNNFLIEQGFASIGKPPEKFHGDLIFMRNDS